MAKARYVVRDFNVRTGDETAAKLMTWIALGMLLGASATLAATDATAVPDKPTFTRDVAPIIFDKCVSCHQPNDIAPMSLRTYEEARPWARSIGKYVKGREMPPWDADPGFGPFTNDRSLNDTEIETIVRWAKKGAPAGDAADLPPVPPVKEAGWTLGEPDYVLELAATDVPVDGPDVFATVAHQTGFVEDKWITAFEVLPGDTKVLHHLLLWQGEDGGGDDPQSLIGVWTAGALPSRLQAGTGRLLKKGTALVSDMHYHPAGVASTDVTRIGLHFAKDEIKKELVSQWIINTDFEIPAGDPYHEVRATYTFPQDSRILAFMPHMHYRGKDFVYTATYPDGRTEDLLRVSDYDFGWQTTYDFEEPVAIPAGTRVDCVAHFDNSKKNPDNPDPTRNVRFGGESFDEMMIGFVDYVVDEGVSPKPPPSPVLAKLVELSQRSPGEVWRVDMSLGPNGGARPTALHLPLQGEGEWWVEFAANIMGMAPISRIVWEGASFTAKVTIPGLGIHKLEGTTDPGARRITLALTKPDGSSESMDGRLAE